MEVLLIGLATAFNFIIIMWKYNIKRVSDASVDHCNRHGSRYDSFMCHISLFIYISS